MAEIVIITDTIGNESFACGGLLSKYSKIKGLEQSERPFVVYTNISDYEVDGKFISKQQQYDEIYKASEILKFNWEVMYEGRTYKDNIENVVGKDRFIKDLHARLEFLNPDTVIQPSFNIDLTSRSYDYPNRNLIDYAINEIHWSLVNEESDRRFGFSRLMSLSINNCNMDEGNFYIQLSPQNVSDKRKSMLCYRSLYKDDVSLIDRTIERNKKMAVFWNKHYVEEYVFIEGSIGF